MSDDLMAVDPEDPETYWQVERTRLKLMDPEMLERLFTEVRDEINRRHELDYGAVMGGVTSIARTSSYTALPPTVPGISSVALGGPSPYPLYCPQCLSAHGIAMPPGSTTALCQACNTVFDAMTRRVHTDKEIQAAPRGSLLERIRRAMSPSRGGR